MTDFEKLKAYVKKQLQKIVDLEKAKAVAIDNAQYTTISGNRLSVGAEIFAAKKKEIQAAYDAQIEAVHADIQAALDQAQKEANQEYYNVRPHPTADERAEMEGLIRAYNNSADPNKERAFIQERDFHMENETRLARVYVFAGIELQITSAEAGVPGIGNDRFLAAIHSATYGITDAAATEHAQYIEALGADYASLSEDMRAATVINSVIAESWDGLYETMSNTPEGKIIQFNNKLGDLRETLGNQIYPYVLKVYDGFTQNFPQIEMVLTNLTTLLGNIVLILGALMEGALNVATAISDNWSWIAPLVMGIVGAFLAYNAALVAYNAIKAISAGVEAIHAAHIAMSTVATGAETTATFAATAAQYGFNAALLACPIFWIVAGVIALIAVIYAAVGAINKFAGTSVSATGIIAGVFAALGAHLINTFVVPVWNHFAAIANFFGNVFNDPVAAVKVLFYNMALTVLGYVSNMAHAIENLINKIPGVTVDITSGLDNFYRGLEEAQQKVKDESGWVEYVQKMDFVDYGEAFDAGYKFGEGVEDTLSNLFTIPSLDDFGFDAMDAFNLGTVVDDIAANSALTAGNTAAMADALDYTEEDLKYLLDIAEREAINRYTTAEITVEQHNENHIEKDADVDGIMDAWAADFAEKLAVSGEGVH